MMRALLATFALFTVVATSGCGRACKDLEDVCNRCGDANLQAACLAVVEADDAQDCADSVEGFEAVCQ